MSTDKLILTPVQLDFMLQHHQEIEQAYDLARRGRNSESLNIIRELSNSQEYKKLFDSIDWDDAFDRYQDSPAYDPTLRDSLIKRTQGDRQSSQLSAANKTTDLAENTNGDTLDLDALGLMRLEELLDTVDKICRPDCPPTPASGSYSIPDRYGAHGQRV